MKKTTISLVVTLILLFGLSPYFVKAQNLIPNPNFEQNANCPMGVGDIAAVQNWYSPTDGSPDYFSSCVSIPSSTDVPSNLWGDQAALSDSSYAGFYAYGQDDLREYLAVKLDSPLEIGKTYCVNFNVSRADFTYIAVANIGMYFSEDSVGVSNGAKVLEVTPQIENTGGVLVNDNDWTAIGGTFVATAGYEFVLIGNFATNENTDTTDLSVPGVGGPFVEQSYYYVEDVSVVALDDVVISISPDNNPVVCQGDEITLSASGGEVYEWVSLDDPFAVLSTTESLTIVPENTQTYMLTVSNGSCQRIDFQTIEVVTTPQAGFTFSPVCAGSNQLFFDNSSNIFEDAVYEWDFNNDGIADANTLGGAEFVFSTIGDFPVTLTITNSANCFSQTTHIVTIADDCDPCNAPQNVVANPHIEFYHACPDGLAQTDRIAAWYKPTDADADYFHACFNDIGGENAGVPNNSLGMQTALSGSSYLGFHAYGPANYREYVSASLVQSLEAGKTYCVSFNVSLGDNSGKAVDNIGLHFSTDSLGVNTQAPLYLATHIQNAEGNILNNKTDWTTISGNYTATGNEQWLTIGNFTDNASTSVESIADQVLEDFGYYFLDDVSVVPMPNLSLENEVTTCVQNPSELVAGGAFCSFEWFEMGDSGTILGTEASLVVDSEVPAVQYYVVKGEFHGCFVQDTVQVNFISIPSASFDFLENCAGAVTSFTNTSSNAAPLAVFEWDFENDGVVDATGTGIIGHIYTEPDTYTVKLTITNPSGCQDSILQTITIDSECDPCENENNVVVNGDFENNLCPLNFGSINFATAWNSPDFMNPADLFSSCNGTTTVGTPINSFGEQAPHSGDTYVGIVAFNGADETAKTYVSGQLAALTIGQAYCVSMFVSRAESSDYAIDQLGIYLSNTPLDNSIDLAQAPQVNNQQFVIVSDTLNWVEIAGTFVADSAYQFLSIGNFESYSTNVLWDGPDVNGVAYYYIDDVTIAPVNIEMPEDPAICLGESVTLSATTNTCEHFWIKMGEPSNILSTDTALTVSPTDTTTYIFFGNNGICSIQDSVTVNIKPLPEANAGQDQSLCIGNMVQLNASGGHIYQWSPETDLSDATSSIPNASPDVTTIYTVTVTDTILQCSATDEVKVEVFDLPVADAGMDTTVCLGNGIRLNATGGDVYQWTPPIGLSNPGLSDPFTTPTSDQTFFVIVTNSATGCQSIDSVRVTVQPPYPMPDTVMVEMCAGDSIQLMPTLPIGDFTYQWNFTNSLTDSTIANPYSKATATTLYTVEYSDPFGCSGQASVLVSVSPVPDAGVDAQICANGSIQLNVSSGGSNYVWSPAAFLDDASSLTPIASPAETTTFTVEVTYPDIAGGCVQTDSVTVFVVQEGFADAGDNVTICPGDSIQLNAIGGDVFDWVNDASLSDTSIFNPYAKPELTTTYFVEVFNSTTGCTSVDSVTVFIKETESPFFLNVDSMVVCVSPLTPYQICLETDYNGCENLQFNVETQLSSSINFQITSDTCFTYESAFTIGRIDTLVTLVCTAESGLCDTLRSILIYCDLPPMWDAESLADTTVVDQAITINATASDPDEDDTLTFSTIEPSNGMVTFGATDIVYTPNPGFVGTDNFSLIVCDALYPSNECDTLLVTIEVLPNAAPMINDLMVETEFNTPVSFCLTIVEPDGDDFTTQVLIDPVNGVESVVNDSCLDYTPAAGFSGLDSLQVAVCDEYNVCATAWVFIEVGVPNTAPVLENISVTTDFETEVTICPMAVDPDDDAVSFSIFETPDNGTVIMPNDTCFVYLPNVGFSGMDTMTVTACDDLGNCSTASIFINVLPQENQPPVVANENFMMIMGETLDFCLNITDPDSEVFIGDIEAFPLNGGLSLVNDTCATYIPNGAFIGNDIMEIQICDDEGLCDTATIVITVLAPVNNAPEANDTMLTVLANTDVPLCLNIVEPDGDDFSIATLTNPANGSVTITNESCLVYMPNMGFVGINVFEVTVCDALGLCDTVSVTVNVQTIPNEPPLVENVTVTVPFESTMPPLCLTVVEPEDEAFTLAILTNGMNGLATVFNNSCINYAANTGFWGMDSVLVNICDINNNCAEATFYITVLPPNSNAPVVADAVFITDLNQNVVDCLDFVEPEGEAVTGTVIQTTVNGDFTLSQDTCILYIPNTDFIGMDSVQIELCDPWNNCDTAWVNFIVEDMNLPPTVADINTNTDFEMPILICPEITEPNGDAITLTVSALPTNGTAMIVNDTCVQYMPNTGFSGTEVINVSVCDEFGACTNAIITIVVNEEVVNNPPVVTTPNPVTIMLGEMTETCLTITEPDGNEFTVSETDISPAQGTVTMTSENCFSYTANNNFVGTVAITIQVCDDQDPALCVDVVWEVTIAEENVPPVFGNTTAETMQNEAVTLCPDIVDPNGDVTSLAFVDAPENGTASFTPAGCILYTPDPTFSGVETFTVISCDPMDACTEAVISITVTPILVAQNDTIATENEVAITVTYHLNDLFPELADLTSTITIDAADGMAIDNGDGTFTYQPNPGFIGIDQFTYQICDPVFGCSTAIVFITVENLLEAIDDAASTLEGIAATVLVLLNDNSPDPALLTVELGDNPQNGIITLNPNMTITYLPEADFVGVDSFTYIIHYPNRGSAEATVYITVLANNQPQPPVAQNDTLTIELNETVNIEVLNNDSDPNDLTLTLTEILFDATAGDMAIVETDGTISYIPPSDSSGTYSFQYIVCNETELCDTASVFITILPAPNCELVVYGAFSPNGDQVNDTFEIDGLADCYTGVANTLVVFNRWGSAVFETANYESGGWDGTFKDSGNGVADGTYFYIFKIPTEGIELQGSVEVHR